MNPQGAFYFVIPQIEPDWNKQVNSLKPFYSYQMGPG